MRRFHNMEFASLTKSGAVTQGVIKGHVKIHRTTEDFMSVKLQPFTVMISVTDNNSRGGDSYMEQTGMLVGNFEFNP